MKRPSLILIPAIFIFYSCHHSELKLIDGPKFGVNKGKQDVADFSNGAGNGASGNIPGPGTGAFGSNVTMASNMSKKLEPETVVEELPRTYKARKFMNDLSGFSYDLFMIPGNIVTFNPKDTTYQMRTLRAITKSNKPPVVTSINDGMLYSAKINSTTSFNGSYLIGGLNVNHDEIMELNIQDVAISTVPDSLIDIDAIKSAIADIPADEKKNLYYIKSATLTVLDSRKYSEGKFDASINSCFITSGGKTYSSNEKFRRDKTVSIYIVPLDHIISAH